MLKITTLIVIVFVLVLSFVSWRGGLFDRIALKEDNVGPYHLVYREYNGPYFGSRYLLKNVVVYLKEKKGVVAQIGFTLFYDEPSLASEDSLRCSAGVIVDSSLIVELPYKYALFEQTDALTGRFPIRSFFSYIIGLYKFHKILDRYCKKNSTCNVIKPILEVYDVNAKQIKYIAPVGRETSPAPEFGK